MTAMRGGFVSGNGTRWWVGRRWLPWRPRERGGSFYGDSTTGGMIDIDGVPGLVIAVVLTFPVLILVAVFVAEWLLAVALLPLAVGVRALFGGPWRVVARSRAADGRRHRYYAQVKGWAASRELIEKAKSEIAAYGQPRCLGAGVAEERDTSTGDPERHLARVEAGEPLACEALVYGTGSPYAVNGWLPGMIRADATSLALSQDGGSVSRRSIPVDGVTAADGEYHAVTETDKAAVRYFAAVAFTGSDGREYRVAAEPEYRAALQWLLRRWSAAD